MANKEYELDFEGENVIHTKCGKIVSAQWDTDAEEPFWHCYECEESFTIDGSPSYHFTSCKK